jgi:hypothetical protein
MPFVYSIKYLCEPGGSQAMQRALNAVAHLSPRDYVANDRQPLGSDPGKDNCPHHFAEYIPSPQQEFKQLYDAFAEAERNTKK